MPRRPRGWTRDKFSKQREAQQRRPLAMHPRPSSNSGGAESSQRNSPSITGSLTNNSWSFGYRPGVDVPPGGGISYLRDHHGIFRPILSLIARKTTTPGIMESCLLRLGHQVTMPIGGGARVVKKNTPMGALELLGTVNLTFRLINRDSSRTIMVDVWRGEEQHGRLDLYFDPLNGSRFLEIQDNQSPSQVTSEQPDQSNATGESASLGFDDALSPPTPPGTFHDFNAGNDPNVSSVPSQRVLEDLGLTQLSPQSAPTTIPHSTTLSVDDMPQDLLGSISQGLVFPINSWGTMSMAVLTGDAAQSTFSEPGVTGAAMPTRDAAALNTLSQDDHLSAPLDLAAAFSPQGHHDHHRMAPDGFCYQCFNDALDVGLASSTNL